MPSSPKGLVAAYSSDVDHDFEDFCSRTTFFFPGQGAQYLGMGVETAKVCPEAKALFARASEQLGYDLLSVCADGPKAKLDTTEVCQPAIFVHSMAAVERLRKEKGDEEATSATACLGLSLGEYSALCYAGAISFADCVKLTKERGAAMQAAAEKQESGMVSVLGLTVEETNRMVEAVECRSGEKMRIANYLSPRNYVVSGSKKGCSVVEQIAKSDFNARLAIPLAVAGAFHTEFMQPAADRLSKVLDEVKIEKPRIPVISNVDGKPHSDPEVIRELLKRQLNSPVQFEKGMKLVLGKGYERGYEVGPGVVLRGILARTDPAKGKTVINVS